jgi:hypothetical protein
MVTPSAEWRSKVSEDKQIEDKQIVYPRERQCTATVKATGMRCLRTPILGGTVCIMHGGTAPQVRAAADQWLREQALLRAPTAFLRLDDFLEPRGPKCEHCGRSDDDRNPVVLQAAKAILDRCGLGPHSTLNIAPVAPAEDFSHLSDEQIVAELEQITLQAKASVSWERPALLPPAASEPDGGSEDIWVESDG